MRYMSEAKDQVQRGGDDPLFGLRQIEDPLQVSPMKSESPFYTSFSGGDA